jgi:hypothetical protein
MHVIGIFLGALIWSSLGRGVGAHFFLDFLPYFLAVAVGSLIVPHEQRKKAALALWILSAINDFLWPTLSGHLTLGNLYSIGVGVAGGGIAYFLVRSGSPSGRWINLVSAQNPQKGPPAHFKKDQ